MTFFTLLYWIIVILCLLGVLAPATWTNSRYIHGGATVILFILLGIKVFPIPMS